MAEVGKQRAKRYLRHTPLAEDKRVRGYRTLALDWSETMAYIVGLLATDGCLSSDRRHIILTSRDRELVETFLACLGRPIKYTVGRTRRGKRAYYAQFSDVAFYDWLLARGLTPRKASRAHIDWLRGRIKDSFGLNGYLERIVRKKRHDLFRLKYGKRESIVLLRLLYSDPNAPCLDRKRRKWIDYALRNKNVCAGGGS